MMGSFKRIALQRRGRPSPTLTGLLANFATLKWRIWLAFVTVSLITFWLGTFAVIEIASAGKLVEKTYDQSLMSISYARAASADFSAMQANFARRSFASDQVSVDRLKEEFDDLSLRLSQDLSIAAERSQSPRATDAAQAAQSAASAWRSRVLLFRDGVADAALWRDLDADAARVSEQIERLVNYTAGDGFIYRQRAKGLIGSEAWLDAVGTGVAILFSGLIAAFLARRIVGSVAAASAFAEKIAAGDFNGELPRRSPDELGALVTSMGVMRDKLRALVEREIAERRSAQVLLADALETSPAGIVMVGASGEISIANSQAVNFFGDDQDVRRPGVALADLTGPLASAIAGAAEMSVVTALADGRWIRVSRSVGHDGGYVAVVSDISELKRQQSLAGGDQQESRHRPDQHVARAVHVRLH